MLVCVTPLLKIGKIFTIGPFIKTFRKILKNVQQNQLTPKDVTFPLDLYLEGSVFAVRVNLKRNSKGLVSDVKCLFPKDGNQNFTNNI